MPIPVPLRPFIPLIKILRASKTARPAGEGEEPDTEIANPQTDDIIVRRHFYNERGFQTYGSFFAHWDGWITAAHVLEEARNLTPPFAKGAVIARPDGLDAALIGCNLPDSPPVAPKAGQAVYCLGYPAGSDRPARRNGKIYLERPGQTGQWIAHIIVPDEPVVTGMSGGCVFDAASNQPIGIIITRNSPADLNNDRDPDESFDFIALANIWHSVRGENAYV